jgi:hypothetical protein
VVDGWASLREELERWRKAGRTADFWWRDDDAARLSPELERLLELAARVQVPLALAVIPCAAEGEWLSRLVPGIGVMPHGFDHENRAPAGEKKSEFPASEPPHAALARLSAGRAKLEALAPGRTVAALTPPWNRIAPALLPRLAGAGFRGLSQYGARKQAEPVPGLRQVNSHVDLVAWRAGRGFIGEPQALGLALAHLRARRAGAVDAAEPTGWLTHHACHDAALWGFLERLFEETRGLARWRTVQELFT